MSAADVDDAHNNVDMLSEKSNMSVNDNVGTFTELKGKINNGVNEFKLDKDYKFNSTKDNGKEFEEWGIKVTRNNYVIDGQGHIIDGSGKAGLLYLLGENITVKNINFINGNARYSVVSCYGDYEIFDGCNFTNNTALLDSGALSIDGGIVSNCNFDHNRGDAGAVNSAWDDIIIVNCTFTNNVGNTGALDLCCNAIVDNCTFYNNVASENEGGAINSNHQLTIKNSKFYQNSAKKGAAIYCNRITNISNCQFVNNSASSSGTVYVYNQILNIENSTFMNNTAEDGTNDVALNGENAALNVDDSSLINLEKIRVSNQSMISTHSS